MSKYSFWSRVTALVILCFSILAPTAAAYDAQAAITPVTAATSGEGTANQTDATTDISDDIIAINAVTDVTSSEGSVRSAAEVTAAAQAAQAQAAAEAAAAQAAKEAAAEAAAAAQAAKEAAARKALLTYTPIYSKSVSYNPDATVPASVKANGTLMGNFKLTFYDDGVQSCGKWAGGNTSSGTKPTEGRTIAVDPSQIPIGSKVYIEGFGDFIAEDVGGAIKTNRIDIFLNSYQRCLQLGVKHAKVYVIK